jgi:hypothetical protein
MNKYNLNDMKNGWFIGDFIPSLYITNNFEIGLKKYDKGQKTDLHFHKKSTEFTLIISGVAKINNLIFKDDDIIQIMPFENSVLEALTDLITIVIKIPSSKNDKFIGEL